MRPLFWGLFIVSVVYFILLLLYNLRHRVATKQAHKLRVKIMKFSLDFIKTNKEMFIAICNEQNLDYIAFYEANGLYVIAECWVEVHKSTYLIEV